MISTQTIEALIESKQPHIDKIQRMGQRLTTREQVEHSMSQIWAAESGLTSLLKQVKSILVTSLEQWRLYHECLQRVNECLSKAEYSISRVNVITGTVDSLAMQVGKLKVSEIGEESSICRFKS